ncbi:MAG: MSMEG_4193 family putative phosphomutase [Candidatus Nanopelagicales bacterium]
MTTVLLIRHGRSVANAQGVLAGRSDTALDDAGREQARVLGERLRDVPLDLLVASPQARAQQTAELVAGARAQMQIDEHFAECDYGDWSGAALSELALEPAWETVQWLPSAAQFPAGETMAQMAHRATHGVQQLVRARPDDFIWVVTHGDIIKAILADALGVHLDHFQRIIVDTASVSVVHYGGKRPFVEKVNDTGAIRLARKPEEKGSDAVVGGESSQ